jgi:hypothetical protein
MNFQPRKANQIKFEHETTVKYHLAIPRNFGATFNINRF